MEKYIVIFLSNKAMEQNKQNNLFKIMLPKDARSLKGEEGRDFEIYSRVPQSSIMKDEGETLARLNSEETGIDIPDQDLIYVPICRKSTIRRMVLAGFDIGPKIWMKDLMGTTVEVRGMTRKQCDDPILDDDNPELEPTLQSKALDAHSIPGVDKAEIVDKLVN